MARRSATWALLTTIAVLWVSAAARADSFDYLPEEWGLTLAGSYSKITTNYPNPDYRRSHGGFDPGPTESHSYPSVYMSLYSDSDEGYSEYVFGTIYFDLVTGYLFVYDSGNPHPEYTFFSRGLIGAYRKGWGGTLGDRARWGVGYEVGDYWVNSTAAENGYHLVAGPTVKLDVLVNSALYARMIGAYDFSVLHRDSGDPGIDRPRFLNLEGRLTTSVGVFVQLCYHKMLPQHTVSPDFDDELTLSRWYVDVGWNWF